MNSSSASGSHIDLIFFCQAIDGNDPVVADTYQRVLYFSKNPRIRSIQVIAVRGNAVSMNEKVRVDVLGPGGANKLFLLYRFFKLMFLVYKRTKFNVIYLYMIPSLAPLFLLFKWLYGSKIVLWFAHSVYRIPTRFAVHFVVDRWISVNQAQANLKSKKIRLVGQGVDTSHFFPKPVDRKYDLITVGRITPMKKLELMVEVLDLYRARFGKNLNILVCGGCYLDKDIEYKHSIEEMIKARGLSEQFHFIGPISRLNLPQCINSAKVFLFTVPGGVGKAAMEALACGVPTVMAEPTAADFFGPELAEYLLCRPDKNEIAERIHRLLSMDSAEKERLEGRIQKLIHEKCSMEQFTSRIVDQFIELVGST